MTALGIILTVVLVFFVALFFAARGRSASIDSVEQLSAMSHPVDLEAFRVLTYASEEEYLRESLEPRVFRRVQRVRLWATLDYLFRAAHNSAIVLRLGEASRRSSNPQISAAGAELADSAMQMRLLCLAAVATVLVRILLPQLRLSPGAFCDRYAATRERAVALGRIEMPSMASRIESAL